MALSGSIPLGRAKEFMQMEKVKLVDLKTEKIFDFDCMEDAVERIKEAKLSGRSGNDFRILVPESTE